MLVPGENSVIVPLPSVVVVVVVVSETCAHANGAATANAILSISFFISIRRTQRDTYSDWILFFSAISRESRNRKSQRKIKSSDEGTDCRPRKRERRLTVLCIFSACRSSHRLSSYAAQTAINERISPCLAVFSHLSTDWFVTLFFWSRSCTRSLSSEISDLFRRQSIPA